MSYKVEFTATGIENLEELSLPIQERMLRKILWLSENFEEVSPQSLSANLSGLFKLRVGDYRMIYSFDSEIKLITVHKIGHRRDVYS
jgi:mRNA interferase RelE/StbE